MFAVIVPTYQKRDSLRELLESLKAQVFKEFKIILVNNNPDVTDSEKFLKSIIEPFQELNITVLSPGENLGAGKGRNYGGFSEHVESCSYFAFIDDDCEADQNWLKVAHEHFASFPEHKVIFGKVTSDLRPYPPFIHGFDMKGGVFGSGNCVIKKEFFHKLKGFDTYLNNWAEDFEFGERCKRENESPHYVEELLVNHPPKLVNYKFTNHLVKPSFYKKYLYLVEVKKYEYKSPFLRDLVKRGVTRAMFLLPFFIFWKVHWLGLAAPFVVHGVLQGKKVPHILKSVNSYSFPNKLSPTRLLNYLLFHWLADIANLLLITTYKLPPVEQLFISQIEEELGKK